MKVSFYFAASALILSVNVIPLQASAFAPGDPGPAACPDGWTSNGHSGSGSVGPTRNPVGQADFDDAVDQASAAAHDAIADPGHCEVGTAYYSAVMNVDHNKCFESGDIETFNGLHFCYGTAEYNYVCCETSAPVAATF